MTVPADGKLLTLNLLLKAWGIPIHVEGTIETLDVRVDLDKRKLT